MITTQRMLGYRYIISRQQLFAVYFFTTLGFLLGTTRGYFPIAHKALHGSRYNLHEGKQCHASTPNVDTSDGIGSTVAVNSTQPYKRRIRYSGSYPKAFSLKYKEMRGDNDVIQKVLSKGGTPAGTHVPIMLKEVMHHMGLRSEDDDSTIARKGTITVDCTLGFGGHSTEIVKCIAPLNGTHFAVDRDPLELSKTAERMKATFGEALLSQRVNFLNQNFESVEESLRLHGVVGKVDSLLADLGFSSMQIDNPERGFTYKTDGPLDMRMDPSKGETAYEYLERVTRDELAAILRENSDETMALEIAAAIKSGSTPKTTLELADRVRNVVKKTATQLRMPLKKEEMDSAVARTMQAIRIEVNGEFRALESLLSSLPRLLAPGGRVVFLTFHSGEDRRVKKSLKSGFKSGIYTAWSRDVIRATGEEKRGNSRSKCAKLRWAIRSESKP